MGKIMGLDIGDCRIGYAVSNEEKTIAFPRETVAKTNDQKFIARLRKIKMEEGISKIVIGVPLDEDNKETPFSKKIRKLGEKIARELILPVEYIDEFGTTNEALSKIPFRRDRIKKGGYADACAAQIILQKYLDANPALLA